MRFKKLLAATLSMTMVFASSAVVFAEETETEDPAKGSTTAEGTVEGYVSTDVFTVVLPTTSETGSAFNFILDPQELIAKTEAAAHTGSTFEDGATMFFANTDGSYSYSSTSDALTITNKSSMDVDVSVQATLSGIDGITMASDDTYEESDTSTSMYLALVNGTTETALTSSGASLTGTINAAPADAFEYTYDNTEKEYNYGLKADTSSVTFSDYTFQMTGSCNSNGDWTDLTDAAPTVEVTWTVTAHVDDAAPSIATTEYVAEADTPLSIAVNLGAGDLAATEISSITFVNVAGNAMTVAADTGYTFEDSTLTFTTATINAFVNGSQDIRSYVIVFDDTAATEITVTLTK